jgi:glutathione reductase (NADPH)
LKRNHENIATVVFSHPPIGCVGITEVEARKRHEKVKIYTSKFTNMFYSLDSNMDERPQTFFKLVCAGDDEKVVGVHAIGRGVDEMM